MKLVRSFSIAVIIAALGLTSVPAQEKKEPTPEEKAVTARQELMHVIAAQRGLIRDMADGKRPTDAAKFTNAANALAALARVIPETFSKNLTTPDSTAKPEVWSDAAGFGEKAKALADKAGAVVALAATDIEAAKAAVKDVNKACGGCHDNYRIEEKK